MQAHERKIALVLWLIDHHPESELHEEPSAWISPQFDSPDAYEDARNRWLNAVNLHPNDARVLGNAAGALRYDSLQEQMDLLMHAQKLDPAHWTEPLARLYSSTLVGVSDSGNQPGNPGVAAQIRNDVQSSNDIALVGSVARHVVELAAGAAVVHPSTWDLTALRIFATELVTHAQSLDPQSREWSDLMEGVKPLDEVKELSAGSPPPAAQKRLPPFQPSASSELWPR